MYALRNYLNLRVYAFLILFWAVNFDRKITWVLQ